MVLCAEAALNANVGMINELNVFPVPDGDTGTNMGLTLSQAAAELRSKQPDTLCAAAERVASGLLRGARGNSGVILSLLARGGAKRLKGMGTAGAKELALAMADGVDAAYKAVMKPAEGTILTVSRLAASAAVGAAKAGADIETTLMCAVAAGNDALENTVNLNPVLKKAGVVDAGGMGYMIILKAMLACVRGDMTAPELAPTMGETGGETPFGAFSTEEITFAYDTVFTVRRTAPDTDIEPFRAYLCSIGDSLVIGEDDGSFKVHVHTNVPGDALNEAGKYGVLELAKIENMRTQHDELLSGHRVQSTDDLAENDRSAEPEKQYGIVAVCAGDGMEALFRELGADGIVTGGQTMNPSTDDILREIDRTGASTVFVFPNNKNIIMAAEQCVPLTDRRVVVIPTRTMPQGITALLNFNPDSDEEELTALMLEAISGVHTAMVTYAARDSDFDGRTIHAGEYLALLDGSLLGSYSGIKTLFKELSWEFDKLEPGLITVYYGADVTKEDASEASRIFEGNFPEAEVSVLRGGQPVYYYMISVE